MERNHRRIHIGGEDLYYDDLNVDILIQKFVENYRVDKNLLETVYARIGTYLSSDPEEASFTIEEATGKRKVFTIFESRLMEAGLKQNKADSFIQIVIWKEAEKQTDDSGKLAQLVDDYSNKIEAKPLVFGA